jgi:hypothetical protein
MAKPVKKSSKLGGKKLQRKQTTTLHPVVNLNRGPLGG